MSYEEIKLQITDKVAKRLKERHILEDDVKQVINNAETTGEKFYKPDQNIYLAQFKVGKATFYVEYSIESESYAIITAYAHKSEIAG